MEISFFAQSATSTMNCVRTRNFVRRSLCALAYARPAMCTDFHWLSLNPWATDACMDARMRVYVIRVRNPRIYCAKRESAVCATKSSDGPHPYFAPNIYIMLNTEKLENVLFHDQSL